ncbi:MAG: hypothetical protein WCY11_19825 [Novosphingobium sp.]
MAGGIDASVTLHVEVFDPQAMWDHAFEIYADVNLRYKVYDPAEPDHLADELHDGFVTKAGSRNKPHIETCLRMIFDHGETPPGIQIDDSSTEVASPAWDDKYPHVADCSELDTEGFG